MSKYNYDELAKRLILKAIEDYKQRFILEEDLMNGEDRRKVVEAIDDEVDEIKHKEKYKNEIKILESKIRHLRDLDDCDEEFEL